MVILVMGTTGAGKTTVGKLIAQELGWSFLDADDFHPPANIEKMKHGIPLVDRDRAPWLANIHSRLLQLGAQESNAVLACSALKRSYRETLGAGLDMRIVYLRGTYEEMRQHILARHGHFAGESILAGQFRDLEEPTGALLLDVSSSPEKLAKQAIAGLGLAPAEPC
jgi:gluconokinase